MTVTTVTEFNGFYAEYNVVDDYGVGGRYRYTEMSERQGNLSDWEEKVFAAIKEHRRSFRDKTNDLVKGAWSAWSHERCFAQFLSDCLDVWDQAKSADPDMMYGGKKNLSITVNPNPFHHNETK
jgi:hypothetical protein